MDSGVVGNTTLWLAVGATAMGIALSFALSFVGQGTKPWFGPFSRVCGLTAAGLTSVSVGALAWSLLTGNFALTYVADTTTRQGSWPYRLAGLWGGSEGSLLLWGWIVLLIGLWAGRRSRGGRTAGLLLGGSILVIVAVVANPFRRLAIPAIDGGGLVPILEHPAMLYHPPLLYAGQGALVAPFVLAVSALAAGRVDRTWLAVTRRWVLAGWLLLTVALVAGAHWSYAELGWGGYWAWDPVENSALLPWLAAAAFLHVTRLRTAVVGDGTERWSMSPGAAAGLAALPFWLCLFGAAVSRSGAAQSVHAFADAAAVGRGLLAILVGALVAVIGLVVVGARHTRDGQQEPLEQRVMWPLDPLLAAGLLLAVVFVVCFGTAFPVVSHVLTGHQVAVTGRYFAVTAGPLAVAVLVAMGLGHQGRSGPRPLVLFVVAAALVAGGLAVAWRWPHRGGGALGGAGAFAAVMAVWLLAGTRTLRRTGGLVAHLGVAVALIGVAGSATGSTARVVMARGSTADVAGYSVAYRDIVADRTTAWQRVRVVVDVSRSGHRVARLQPGLRFFPDQTQPLADVSIHSTVALDLVVAVRTVDATTNSAVLQITARPLVVLVWWGGLIAAAGGGIGLVDSSGWWRRRRGRRRRRRRHEGAPARRPSEAVVVGAL